MGEKTLKIETVHQCNCCLGGKTLHPLVSIIDLSKAPLTPYSDIKFGFYTILLSECKREAQFITRNDANKEIIEQFNHILEDYFETNQPQISGLPSDAYCAEKLRLSPAYLIDLLKVETGKGIQESIQVKRINIAQRWLLNTNKSIRQIALELGFQNPQHFSYLFSKATGCSPNDSRIHN